MEDDGDPSSDFEPLFIREENGDPETNWSPLDFTRTHVSQPSPMGPYLLEMDDLLKRCEELTAIPLQLDPEQMLGERETSPYFSTSHTGNTMGTADECAEHQFHEDMPITSSGNKLSSTMVQYEGQLMGMLAMLESCMDEAPVDFEMNQEYVHVNKVKDMTSELQSFSHRDPPRNSSSESEVHDREFKYSMPSMTVGCTSRVDDVNVTDSPTESLEMEMSFAVDGFQTLASQMEKCIEELQRLERKRKDLLAEVLELRRQEAQEEEEEEEAAASEAKISNRVKELMAVLRKEEEDRREERKREVQLLRSEVAEEERRVWKAEMEKQELRDEMRKLKRQLFTKAKESAHIQAALNKRRHEMDLQKREEEKLHTLLREMTEEGSQLKSQHQQYLQDLRAEICVCTASRTCNTTQEEELSRRNSCGDIQQYLQDSLRALENRYEPVLLGLQKRKETTTRASLKAKEQTRELKAQLGPLREEMQAQVLQRARLEEKLKLVHVQRREDTEHYEESIRCLERSSRELKMELTVQRRKNKEAADLRDCLSKQILLYRSAAGDHQKSEHQKEA